MAERMEVPKKVEEAYLDPVLVESSNFAVLAKECERVNVPLHLFSDKDQEMAAGGGSDDDEQEDSEVLSQIRRKVDRLQAEFKKLNTEEFLKYVYGEYRPRGLISGSYRLRKLSTEAATLHALTKAIQHYHPDHNAYRNDRQWIALCGEITKLLLQKHRMYSNDECS